MFAQAETYVASSLGATTTAHHGGLDRAAPPAGAGAGLVVDQRQVGLLQLSGEAAAGYAKSNREGETH